jgi:hypothetical protein
MIESLKKMEILIALKYRSDEHNSYGDLITQLFLDFPNLKNIQISKTQEYNDNDYSDYFTVKSVNGIRIEDDIYDKDDESYNEIVRSSPHLVFNNTELDHIICVLNITDDYFENNYEDNYQSVEREDFVEDEDEIAGHRISTKKKNRSSTDSAAFDTYYFAAKNKQKISDFSVFKDSPNWALYYCMDLDEKLPEPFLNKIFKEDVKYAYLYAKNVSKDRLPKNIEKYFDELEKNLAFNSFENKELSYSKKERQEKERYYISKYREFVKSLCTTN